MSTIPKNIEGAGLIRSRIIIELETAPAMHLTEMENFARLAARAGKSVDSRVVELIREELAAAAAGLNPAAA